MQLDILTFKKTYWQVSKEMVQLKSREVFGNK